MFESTQPDHIEFQVGDQTNMSGAPSIGKTMRGQEQSAAGRPAKSTIGPNTTVTPADQQRCRKLFLRICGPSLFLGVLFFGSCFSAAVSLQRQQGRAVTILDQVVASREVDLILDKAVVGMEALKPDEVAVAWEQLGGLIARVEATTDRTSDRVLASRLRRVYESVPGLKTGESPESSTLRAAVHNLRVLCLDLKERQSRRIAACFESQAQAASVAGWGLLTLGTLGSGAGILLGLGVARGMSRAVGIMSAQAKTIAERLDRAEDVLTDGCAVDRLGLQLVILSRGVDQVMGRLHSRELELQHVERLANLGRLAAGVAHELRNPLFAVKALVQINREEAETRGLPADDLRIIETELRGMEGQMRSLIGLARQSRDGTRVTDLADAARHAVALFRGRSRTQRVDLRADLPEQEMHVQGDPEQIQQVAVNLLQNALDATPEGGRVEVEVRRTAFDQIEFIVRDDGSGIDAGILPTIFEPFVSSKSNGLGIGLAVARRIADSLGGSLSATNLPRRGACFTFRLPPPPAQRLAAVSKDEDVALEAGA